MVRCGDKRLQVLSQHVDTPGVSVIETNDATVAVRSFFVDVLMFPQIFLLCVINFTVPCILNGVVLVRLDLIHDMSEHQNSTHSIGST